jgi:ATP-binding cassette subfamily B protein
LLSSSSTKAEHEILISFREMVRGKTAVIISHRLALARAADRIAVMEHGRIAESGTHEELMSSGNTYHAMFTRQASGYV